jgi:DNA-binding NtrC family response regulator
VAAALVGAFLETLGYRVRFNAPEETPQDAMRRIRPAVALVDSSDPGMMTDEMLGRSRMRGVPVVIFGSPASVDRVNSLASSHQLECLVMPVSPDDLDATIRRAMDHGGDANRRSVS